MPGGNSRKLTQVAAKVATAPAPRSAGLPPGRISQRTANSKARAAAGRSVPGAAIFPGPAVRLVIPEFAAPAPADRPPWTQATTTAYGARTRLRRGLAG